MMSDYIPSKSPEPLISKPIPIKNCFVIDLYGTSQDSSIACNDTSITPMQLSDMQKVIYNIIKTSKKIEPTNEKDNIEKTGMSMSRKLYKSSMNEIRNNQGDWQLNKHILKKTMKHIETITESESSPKKISPPTKNIILKEKTNEVDIDVFRHFTY